jgi:subfamily B ATP-binding cassette protein MsbA
LQALQPAELSNLKVYSRLLTYTKRYWVAFAIGVVGFVIYASTQWVWAELIKYIVSALEKRDEHAKNWIALSIAAIFLVRGIGSFLGSYGISYVARHVVHNLRQQMFDHLLYFESRYFQSNAVGRLVAKITYNIEQVAAASTDSFKTVLQEGFTVLGLMVYLSYTQWKLSVLFVAVAPLIAWAVTYTSRRLRLISHQIQESMGDVAHLATETLSSFETVKIYGGEDYEQQRFSLSSERNLKQSVKLVVTQSLNTPLVQFIVAAALSLIVWLALQPRIFGETTAGEFLAFITAAGMLAKPIRQLTQVNTTLQRGIAGARSIFELLDLPLEADPGQLNKPRVTGHLQFDQVSFAYPGSETAVLTDINFTLQPGERVALVGRSGAGKTTLGSLVPRFLVPTAGQIYLDQQPLTDFQLLNLRQQIAIVSQRFQLFNDTIYKNIAYGDLQTRSEAQVWQAVEQASARHFIEALPNGIHTLVGENGVQLSGGQQQRIALARALLKDAPIIILDEATSALDPETEAAIQRALNIHLRGRTALVIAHRAATIENADRIIVLDQGRIVEQGTHQQLLAAQGLYASLYPSTL